MVNCDGILAEASRLKSLFKKCYNVKPVDFRAIIELIESVKTCGGQNSNLKTINNETLIGTGNLSLVQNVLGVDGVLVTGTLSAPIAGLGNITPISISTSTGNFSELVTANKTPLLREHLANKGYVDDSVSLKADKAYVDARDSLKADTTYVDASLSLKANITYVDNQDLLKASIIYVNAQNDLKANINSPTFTGVPSTPTAPLGDISTKIVNTEFLNRAIQAIPTGGPNNAVLLTTNQIVDGYKFFTTNGNLNSRIRINHDNLTNGDAGLEVYSNSTRNRGSFFGAKDDSTVIYLNTYGTQSEYRSSALFVNSGAGIGATFLSGDSSTGSALTVRVQGASGSRGINIVNNKGNTGIYVDQTSGNGDALKVIKAGETIAKIDSIGGLSASSLTSSSLATESTTNILHKMVSVDTSGKLLRSTMHVASGITSSSPSSYFIDYSQYWTVIGKVMTISTSFAVDNTVGEGIGTSFSMPNGYTAKSYVLDRVVASATMTRSARTSAELVATIGRVTVGQSSNSTFWINTYNGNNLTARYYTSFSFSIEIE